MRKIRGERLFIALAMLLLAISIGFNAFKDWMIQSKPAFAVGVVDDYKSYARDVNNRIEYSYDVQGKTFHSKFRDSDLPTNLKGQHIVVKYCRSVPRWNEPLYQYIVPDSTGTLTEIE